MSTKELIQQEVEGLPESLQREVYDFARFLKSKAENESFNGLLASESVLARDWNTSAEDAAWQTSSGRHRGPAVSADQFATGKAPPRLGCRRFAGRRSDPLPDHYPSASRFAFDCTRYTDIQSGKLHTRSNIRPNRLFTVEQSVILYTAAHVTDEKLGETLAKLRQLFS
jgi:hypothetical protein